MNPFIFLSSNLKTRCLYFVTYININGESQECEIEFGGEGLVIKNTQQQIIFKCYLFEMIRVHNSLFSCSTYSTISKRMEHCTLVIPDFDDEEIDEVDCSFFSN